MRNICSIKLSARWASLHQEMQQGFMAVQARRAGTMHAVAHRATVCRHLCFEKPGGLAQ
jgi:hypothetical protein